MSPSPKVAQALVVSGFLGSGKTTLVRHLLEEGQRQGVRTAVVSNEFDALGIDEALLSGVAKQVSEQGFDFVELSGGCVCCRLSDDLLRTLQLLWERSRPERIIVETSGVALPYDTLINFWRDPVRAWAVDASSVVVVSAEQVAQQRDLDATFEDQVCAADYLLLSKTDLVGEEESAKAERQVKTLAADVPMLRATFGVVDSRIFFPPEAGSRGQSSRRGRSDATPPTHGQDHDHDQDHDHQHHQENHQESAPPSHHASHDLYRSQELSFSSGVPEEDVLRVLTERGALRTKGFVQTERGLRLVQGVAGRIEITETTATPPPGIVGRIVVIERADADANTQASIASAPTPTSAPRPQTPPTPTGEKR